MNHKTDPKIEEIIKEFDNEFIAKDENGDYVLAYDDDYGLLFYRRETMTEWLRFTLTDFAQSVREEEREKHKQELEGLRMKKVREEHPEWDVSPGFEYGYNDCAKELNTKLDLLLSKNEGEK